MVSVEASLLAADFACLGEEVRRADQAGVDALHLDIMDTHYVRNLALTPHHIMALRKYTPLPFHVHLEIDNPDRFLDIFGQLCADYMTVQADTLENPEETFSKIRAQGAKVGLAINPDVEIKSVKHLFKRLDMLVILAVEPGFGGQEMNPNTPNRIIEVCNLIEAEDLKIEIAVDGGIRPTNAGALVKSGANRLIIGSCIFQTADISAAVRAFKGLTSS